MVRTLVVHVGGIGDFLLSCPAIARLAAQGPVEVAGPVERVQLAVAAGIAQAAHSLDGLQFETVFTTPSAALRERLSRFGRVIVWMRDPGEVARAIHSCGVEDVRTFPGLPPQDWSVHASRYYLKCLGFEEAAPFRLRVEPSATPRDVILHPGSGGQRKNWPLDRYEGVADVLRRGGRTLTWCLGPAEDDLPVLERASVLRTGSLLELARELAAGRLYLGNDSGVTHLAAAVGCPTVAIFGPTDPRVWRPLGAHVVVVQGTPWPDVADVLDAVGCCV